MKKKARIKWYNACKGEGTIAGTRQGNEWKLLLLACCPLVQTVFITLCSIKIGLIYKVGIHCTFTFNGRGSKYGLCVWLICLLSQGFYILVHSKNNLGDVYSLPFWLPPQNAHGWLSRVCNKEPQAMDLGWSCLVDQDHYFGNKCSTSLNNILAFSRELNV